MRIILGLVVGIAFLVGAPTPSRAQDRWQLHLSNGQYVYDLQLVKLEDSALVVRQGGKTLTVPLTDIDQLVLVQATMRWGAAMSGAHDIVYQLTLLTPQERLGVLREVFKRYEPQTP